MKKIEYILPMPPEEVRRTARKLSMNVRRGRTMSPLQNVYGALVLEGVLSAREAKDLQRLHNVYDVKKDGHINFGGLADTGWCEIELHDEGNSKTRLTIYPNDNTWPKLFPCWELLRDEWEPDKPVALSKQVQRVRAAKKKPDTFTEETIEYRRKILAKVSELRAKGVEWKVIENNPEISRSAHTLRDWKKKIPPPAKKKE